MKKIKYKRIVCVLALMAYFNVNAQQEAMYSQYMFNTMAVNPSYAGSREVFSMTALARAQWVGIEGAPVSQTLSMDAPIRNKKVGVGMIIFNDRIGLTHNVGAHGSYAYRVRMKRATLSMGLKLGMVQYNATLTQARLSVGTPTDDQGFSNNIRVWIPSAGAGFYINSDKYYFGASIPNLYSSQWTRTGDVKVNKYDHIFAMAGYVFKVSPDIRVKPSFLMKYVNGAPIELDINTNVWFYERFGFGLSYRTGDAIVGMFEIQVQNNFRVGYSYDYTITALQKYTTGSHELMLRYEFGVGKDRVITPRYF